MRRRQLLFANNNLTFATYLAKTQSEGIGDDDMSYRAQMEYGGDRYGLQLERLSIDKNFNPEVGFLRRNDMRKDYALLRFSPRPKKIKSVRKFSGIGQINYIEDSAGRLSTRIIDGEAAIEFQNSDRFSVGVNDDYELLLRPFTIVPGARVPPGGYDFTTGRVGYVMGQQRKVSAAIYSRRGLLRRPHGYHFESLAHQRVAAAVARAKRLDQLDRASDRFLHHQAGRRPHHLHDDAAALRQRARAVRLEHPHRQRQRAPPLEMPVPAASSSSSTTRERDAATRPRLCRDCSTAPSS